MNVEKVKEIVSEYYERKLKRAIQNADEWNYPIVRSILIVKAFEIGKIIFIIFGCSYFLGIVWLIFCQDVENWKSHNMIDVYNGKETFYTFEDY